MLYNIIFAVASLVMYVVFGLPGAVCAAIAGGTIKFNIMWWAVAFVELIVMTCVMLYWNIKRGA